MEGIPEKGGEISTKDTHTQEPYRKSLLRSSSARQIELRPPLLLPVSLSLCDLIELEPIFLFLPRFFFFFSFSKIKDVEEGNLGDKAGNSLFSLLSLSSYYTQGGGKMADNDIAVDVKKTRNGLLIFFSFSVYINVALFMCLWVYGSVWFETKFHIIDYDRALFMIFITPFYMVQ